VSSERSEPHSKSERSEPHSKSDRASSDGLGDVWLQRNTYHHSDFDDLGELVAAKERLGTSISLCIPALNEEPTIGKEVVIFRSELMDRYPLLDEIAVLDSGSEDATREVALDFGAEVYLAEEILPHLPRYRGKGENLWKAIYQLRGDIIVYVDADITNIHPRFVYGLVGPLLSMPEVSYVKAFYDRPLAESGRLRPSGGGRVTEILIRPLFSLFFPELSALIQPLSGEYAVRREVLERIPFPVGYGVETSHIIDVYHRWGMGAFAQTDLDRRIHTNQPTEALGRMAFGILQTFFKRIDSLDIIGDLPALNATLNQFMVDQGRYEALAHEIRELERPPMIEVPAYREKRSIDNGGA
jgi:glucosyl-3-phosphoglycerate synthase